MSSWRPVGVRVSSAVPGALTTTAVQQASIPNHSGMGVVEAIGPLVSDYNVTFLLATPTFLQLYTRGCSVRR